MMLTLTLTLILTLTTAEGVDDAERGDQHDQSKRGADGEQEAARGDTGRYRRDVGEM